MTKSFLFFLLFSSVISCSGEQENDDRINAITDRAVFTREKGFEKLKLVTPIREEAIHGEWKVILSLFTVTSRNGERGNSTFGMEGNRAEILPDGKFISHFPDGNKNGKWSLTENKTVFNEWFDGKVFESFQVRVHGDTMEWIRPSNDEIMYFVLVKQ